MLMVGLLFTGCQGRRDPSSVVRQLHTAVRNGDNGAISNLMTAEAAGLALKLLSDLQESYTDSGGIASMEQNISGDTATVKVTYRNGDTDTYDLVRVDGRWRVTIAK